MLLLGLGVLCLRPALPIDETRYLQVFQESLRGSPLLLTLCGEPYAEKPPLLFWLGRALTWLSISPETALRCLPVLAAALSVFLVADLGARLGLSLAGWVQAALWIPALSAQFLFFDPLLTLTILGALAAWVRQRDVSAALWSAAALLAKGPVAFLFLIPFLWSTAPLRATRAGALRRAAWILGLALFPLAAWGLWAAAQGGPGFANALLVERWAGRIAGGAHARPPYFYLPIVLVGALPASFVLFLRPAGSAPEWVGRSVLALLLVLVVFSAIRGKQAHYLVPAAPVLALVLTWRLENDARAAAWLRRGACLQLGLLLLLIVGVAIGLARPAELTQSFGERGRAWLASGAWVLPLALSGTLVLAALALVVRTAPAPRALLALTLLGSGGGLLPIHHVGGVLLHPHELAATLASHDGPLAFYGGSQHGLYALLAGARTLEKLGHEDELVPWSLRHPDGLLLVELEDLRSGVPAGLATLARDEVHRSTVLVLRAREPRAAAARSVPTDP